MLPNRSSLNMLKFMQVYKHTVPRIPPATQTLYWSRPLHHVGNQRSNNNNCNLTILRCKNATSAVETANKPTWIGFQNINSSRHCHNGNEPEKVRKQILMSPWRAMKTSAKMYYFKLFLDKNFQIKPFIDGTIQAFKHVTKCLASGEHEELKELLTIEVMRKVYSNTVGTPSAPIYAVEESDIVHMFVGNVDIINGDDDSRIVEIMAVYCFKKNFERDFKRASTFDAVASMPDKLDFSNYRFVRHYSGNEPITEWRINHICHFTIQDMKKNY